MFIATTAKSADIMPETACYQRRRKKNKDLGELRTRSWEVMQKINQKLEDSAAKETKEERSVSSNIDGV